jgi:hypothetical protein
MRPEEFENFDRKSKCKHGNARIVLPEGIAIQGGGLIDKKTGGLVEVNKKPVWINACKTITSARHGFVPITLKNAIERLGEKEGRKYYEKWWCLGEFRRQSK